MSHTPIVRADSAQRRTAELLTGEALANFGGSTEAALIGVAMDAIVLLDTVDPDMDIDQGAIVPVEVRWLNDVLGDFPHRIIDQSRKNLGM
jgi:hypothetical protein